MKTILVAAILLAALPVVGQQKEHRILTTAEGTKPETATINDFEDMVGYWKGEGLGGVSEELWMPPTGGMMHGVFRLTIDGKLIFTEYMTLSISADGAPTLKVKHFNPDFNGWEEKDKAVDFQFLQKKGHTFYFNTMTYEHEGKDKLTIYILLHGDDGKATEEKFVLKKSRIQ